MTDVDSVRSSEGSTKIDDSENSQTATIFKQALTFNVIAKYDPHISQLLHISSYCVIYHYDEDSQDWTKTSFNGPTCVYARRSIWDDSNDDNINKVSVDELTNSTQGNYYKFGLLVLNRSQPENFSLGFLADRYIDENDINEDKQLLVEKSDELIIVRDFTGKAFGLWVFDEKDRDYLYKILLYCTEKLD